MTHSELLDKIELLREKSETKKLVVFVGAGVSCNVDGMPSWKSLVEKMAESIKYSKCTGCKLKSDDCKTGCLFINEYSTDEFLKIPQYVYNENKDLYKKVLQENIQYPETNAPLSSSIFDINPDHIITTNYDSLLESSLNAFAEQYQVIIKDKDLLESKKSKYIVKMHGDISDLDTIVLKENDYLSFSQNHVLIELFVKSLLVDHTVLFLGYSLNDYNIKLIINWLNHMRTQNKALNNEQKVGYIILDETKIDDQEVKYFANNQIDVVNINKINMVEKIPEELTDDRGKRLYSFLKQIADPTLVNRKENILREVRYMSKYRFIEYYNLLSLLNIKSYSVCLGVLELFKVKDYELIIGFLESTSEEVALLRRLFRNAGIYTIKLNSSREQSYIVSEFQSNDLFECEEYRLYMHNLYSKLEEKIKPYQENSNIKTFYTRFLVHRQLYNPKDDTTSMLKGADKLAYLFNNARLSGDCSVYYSTIKTYIDNISSEKEKKLLSFYNVIFSGDSQNKYNMFVQLNKLKETNGHILDFIGKIQRIAYTQYYLYFYNNLIFIGFADLESILKIYIEAIISINSKKEVVDTWFGIPQFNNKYLLKNLDIDIMSKFISPKKLVQLIDDYKLEKIEIKDKNSEFMVECFVNIINTIVDDEIYGRYHKSFEILENLSIMLVRIPLNANLKAQISEALIKLFGNEKAVLYIFSTDNFERNLSLKIFENILSKIDMPQKLSIIKNIISVPSFIDYYTNVSSSKLRVFLSHFVSNTPDIATQKELKSFIDGMPSFKEKEMLLQLFFIHISEPTIKSEFMEFLANNSSELSIDSIYDFVFRDWMQMTEMQSRFLINKVIELESEKIPGVRKFPDRTQMLLDCVYILYIHDIISDISKLNGLQDSYGHLKFLLNPNEFDYTNVDFSNYMWVNFSHHEKFMKHFVKNREIIIPKIKERIKIDEATEDEKKILYGFLLDKDDIFIF